MNSKKAAPSPAKRQRKGSLSHNNRGGGSLSSSSAASSSIGLASAATWGQTMNRPFYNQLGRARSDWELPDIGSASINAVSTWDKSEYGAGAGGAGVTVAGGGGSGDSSLDNKKRREGGSFTSSSMKMTQQHFSQQQTMPPKPSAGPAVGLAYGSSSSSGPPAGGSSGQSRNLFPPIRQQQQKLQPQHTLGAPPTMTLGGGGGGGGISSTATVVTNSTMGSSTSGKSVSSISTGHTIATTGSRSTISSLSSQQGIYSSGTFRTPAGAVPPPPVQPAVATAAPATAAPTVVPATVPKATLYQFYGKKPRRKQLSNEDYFAWNNGGRPHELKFTAIFQCPVTGECFASGRYGDPKFYEVTTDQNNQGQTVEIVWYTKKAFAEHGAAARCYDCQQYREAMLQPGGNDQAINALEPISSELPYTQSQAPPLPLMPNLVAEKIRTNQQRIQQVMGATAGPR